MVEDLKILSAPRLGLTLGLVFARQSIGLDLVVPKHPHCFRHGANFITASQMRNLAVGPALGKRAHHGGDLSDRPGDAFADDEGQ